MTSQLTQKVINFCQKNSIISKHDGIVVGVSGGPDSVCLLHVLKSLAPQFELSLTVAHVNHQLRDDAQADEDFVREVADRWGLPIHAQARDVARLAAERKQSLEETARQVRYAFLWQVAEQTKANKIAVGHNADDQAETVLMHFLRGTGLAGLRGMRPVTKMAALRLGEGLSSSTAARPAPQLIRPLLDTPRSEIETYCQAYQLQLRRDPSNQDVTLFRNRLRHKLLPLLETYNPNIRQVLQRTAKVVAAEVDYLNRHVEEAWQFTTHATSTGKVEFDLNNWLSLPPALMRSTLRRAVQMLRRNLRDINFDHIETAIAIIKKGKTGTKATLPNNLLLTVGYDTFTVADQDLPVRPDRFSQPYLGATEGLPVNVPGITDVPHSGWKLKAELFSKSQVDQDVIDRGSSWEAYLDAEVVGRTPSLRPRRPGDIFFPLGLGGHRKKVNEFMINEKIPADRRNHLPLLVTEGQILWVCGYRIDERARVKTATQLILHLRFEHIAAGRDSGSQRAPTL